MPSLGGIVMNDIQKTMRMNMLIDLYGDLLTQKQQQYLAYYYEDDLSLSEMAEELEVSRNACYDQIKRATKQLENYEDNLHLLEKYEKRQALIEEIEQDQSMDHQKIHHYIDKLKDL